MQPSDAVVIVGGGAIGSAIACFLSEPETRLVDAAGSPLDVVVVERDPTYAQASSALSASSIRMQFSTPVNIELSSFGIEFLRDVDARLHVVAASDAHDPSAAGDAGRVDVGLVEGGYLYLASCDIGAALMRRNHATQRALGADVALLSPDALRARFPWLNVSDLALGALGLSGEGWFDGYALLQALRRKARAQGVRYLHAEAVGLDLERRDGGAAHVRALQLASGASLACGTLVNAAGPWSARVAAWAGIALPVVGRRRTVFHVSSPALLAPRCPLLIDPSGVWLRPEGTGYLCGCTPAAVDDVDFAPLDRPDLDAFESIVWPVLAHRVEGFDALRVQSAWAGYYEMNTFDQNGFVGLHPQCDNLVFATGFSGHGLQHAAGVGRGVAELINHGAWRTLDLSVLSPQRLVDGRPLVERNVI